MSVVCRKEVQGDGTLISISGEIDESAVLKGLFTAGTRRILIDLSGVTRINSVGIRGWVNAVDEIPPDKEVEFIRCPRALVKQFNLIANFSGCGKVVSFFAPYFCSGCQREETLLISIPDHLEELLAQKAPLFPCENCGEPMFFDELEERYFAFVDRQYVRSPTN